MFHVHKYKNTNMFLCKDDFGDKVIEQRCKCGKNRYYHRLSGLYLPSNPIKNNYIVSDISESNSGLNVMTYEDKISDLSEILK